MRRSAQHGIALVITLIMLAVVTLLAIVFLGISRRERTSVAVTADLTTARFMADTAVARAQAEMISRIAAESNLFAYDYQVSTNFINPVGFQPALGSNLLNVSYTYADGTLLNADDLRRNLANLYYDPRPPVLIVTNSATGEQETMQAIQTKYIGHSNTKGSRIKAWCERGSITVPFPHGVSHNDSQAVAVRALVEKFVREDQKEYGTPTDQNPWNRPCVRGGLPGRNGGECFVFVDEPTRPMDFPKGA